MPSSDSEDSSAETDASVSTVSTVASDASHVSVRSSSRIRRKKKNDDSLQEELEKKVAAKKAKNKLKAKPAKKVKELGVKPSKQSAAQRKVLLKQAEEITKLVNSSSVSQKQDVPAPNTSKQVASIDIIGSLQDSELTPRKKMLMERIRQLEQQPLPAGNQGVNILSPATENGAVKSGSTKTDVDISQSENGQSSKGDTGGLSFIPPTSEDHDPGLDQPDANDDIFGADTNTTVVAGVNSKVEHNDSDSVEEEEVEEKKRKRKKSKSSSKKSKKHKRKKSKSKKKKKKYESSDSSDSDSSSDESSNSSSSSDSDSKKKKKKKKKRKKRRKEEKSRPVVKSDQLRFTSESSDVEELVKGSSIYIKSATKTAIERSAKTHTSVARNFLVAVFKTEALCDCSLKGNPTRGPFGKIEEPRPPLCQPAVEAVISAALSVAQKNKNIVIREPGIVNHEIATKQSELRGERRKQNQNL